jgi:hypothetical protein
MKLVRRAPYSRYYPHALALASAAAYFALGMDVIFIPTVLISIFAFYRSGPRAGAVAFAAPIVLSGALFALGLQQAAFRIAEIAFGMLLAATAAGLLAKPALETPRGARPGAEAKGDIL